MASKRSSPRFRTANGTELLLEGRIPAEVRAQLGAWGHDLMVREEWSTFFGGGQGIMVDQESGVFMGGAAWQGAGLPGIDGAFA